MSRPSRPQRVACLLVPDLPLAAELRASPELAGLPLVVASAPGSRAFVVSASPEARASGARAGAPLVHARAVCAELRVRVASPALERAARAALLDAALAFGPRVAAAPRAAGAFGAEAAVFVDAAGIASLFRSEEAYATALAARAASLGLPAMACVADSREVARLAARRLALDSASARVLVLPPGEQAAFLAPLPIDLLDPPDDVAQTLTRFGVRSVGELVRLPARGLTARLGPGLARLLARVHGEELEPPLPYHRETRCEEAQDLDHPVEQIEPLAFVLRGLLSRLLARLDARGLACGALALELGLEGGRRDARRIGVAAPTREVRTLLRLVSLALEQRPPAAAVVSVALGTRGLPARRDQLDLFRPAGPAPTELARTLAELAALCGEDRVGAPAVRDEHRPDAWALEPFAPQAARVAREPTAARVAREPTAARTSRVAVEAAGAAAAGPGAAARTGAGPRLGLRALRPPQPAEVTAPGGCPQWVRSRVASGRVLARSGPWRTTGGWWSPDRHHAFDHWDVETSDGVVSRLRHDRSARRWEIDGLYD